MTSRSKNNDFSTVAARSFKESGLTSCRFCPDWATSEDDAARSDALSNGKNGAKSNGKSSENVERREAEEFSNALEKYKLIHRRRIVSCEEALAVIKSLGYRKTSKK